MRGEPADVEQLYQIVLYCEKLKRAVDDFNSDYAKFTDLKYERDCDACAFYRKLAAKAPCFSYGDEAAPKICWNRK